MVLSGRGRRFRTDREFRPDGAAFPGVCPRHGFMSAENLTGNGQTDRETISRFFRLRVWLSGFSTASTAPVRTWMSPLDTLRPPGRRRRSARRLPALKNTIMDGTMCQPAGGVLQGYAPGGIPGAIPPLFISSVHGTLRLANRTTISRTHQDPAGSRGVFRYSERQTILYICP